ncbi:uncharacterized protein TM35_000441800 [Trypanosoma theileri]|uniref:Uncharacterized protein n=1 Tax=Trypanosoma theileri TaxID=67003 RepID=A0A1X0NIE0_9TRYP|nr:uncharacterized protein TM35_000441800 [Trypanosoma theileri]ORC84524.1 hypothetical protein TM35_000441800 [Trypanosoma theileri]
MAENQNVRSGDIILAQLHELRSNPMLRQYLNQSETNKPAGNNVVTDTTTGKTTLTTTTKLKQAPERESLLSFQTRWSKEEEYRLQQSLKAQLEFQEAMKSLSLLGGNYSTVRSSNNIKTNTVSNSALSENLMRGEEASSSIKVSNNANKGDYIPMIIEDNPSAVTLQEKLELRDRTIQRLQKELDETRSIYENELARVKEAHRCSKRESDAEIAELKEQMRQLVAEAANMENMKRDGGVDTMNFLETLDFKESLLQEMHDSFQKASEEWKSNAARSVMSLSVHTEAELAKIVNRGENLLMQVEKSLEELKESRTKDILSFTESVAHKVMQDESALLSSYESKLREHVRSTVKQALRNRMKDIVRPLIEQELLKRRGLYIQENTSNISSPAPVPSTLAAAAEGTVRTPSMTESRRDETFFLFQHLLPQREMRTPSQVRERSSSALGGISTVLGGRSRSSALHRSPRDISERPHWLDRYCY